MQRGCINIEPAAIGSTRQSQFARHGLFAVLVFAGCCRSSAPAAKAPNQAPVQGAVARGPVEAPKTADACKLCNGDFGPHGLDPNPTCNCRTADAGKRCLGKDECEAECVGDLGDREVTSQGPPAMGHWVGRCAEFRTTFGCHVFLPPHGASPAPVRLDQAPEQLCVD